MNDRVYTTVLPPGCGLDGHFIDAACESNKLNNFKTIWCITTCKMLVEGEVYYMHNFSLPMA